MKGSRILSFLLCVVTAVLVTAVSVPTPSVAVAPTGTGAVSMLQTVSGSHGASLSLLAATSPGSLLVTPVHLKHAITQLAVKKPTAKSAPAKMRRVLKKPVTGNRKPYAKGKSKARANTRAKAKADTKAKAKANSRAKLKPKPKAGTKSGKKGKSCANYAAFVQWIQSQQTKAYTVLGP